jgi:hypothetical protein
MSSPKFSHMRISLTHPSIKNAAAINEKMNFSPGIRENSTTKKTIANGSEMSSADIPQQLAVIVLKPDPKSYFRLPSASAPLSG